jgi:hypothetical protein
LISAIGYTLESEEQGKHCVQQVCGRLLDLKTRKGKNGKVIVGMRTRCLIQDVLDLRSSGWKKKSFKAVAKTKEEIRLEQEKELQAAARGQVLSGAQMEIAGQRKSVADGTSKGFKKEDDWQEAKPGKTRR